MTLSRISTAVLLLALTTIKAQDSVDNNEVDASSAEEYLGSHTYFRSWVNKRRLFVIKTNDAGVTKFQRSAIYGFRCQLAIRNVNLVLLGILTFITL